MAFARNYQIYQLNTFEWYDSPDKLDVGSFTILVHRSNQYKYARPSSNHKLLLSYSSRNTILDFETFSFQFQAFSDNWSNQDVMDTRIIILTDYQGGIFPSARYNHSINMWELSPGPLWELSSVTTILANPITAYFYKFLIQWEYIKKHHFNFSYYLLTKRLTTIT